MLKFRLRQGWFNAMQFALTDDAALMPALGFAMAVFSSIGFITLGWLMRTYESRVDAPVPRELGFAIAGIGVVFALLMPLSVGVIWAFVGVWVAWHGEWGVGASSRANHGERTWTAPSFRSGTLVVVALAGLLAMSASAFPGLQVKLRPIAAVCSWTALCASLAPLLIVFTLVGGIGGDVCTSERGVADHSQAWVANAWRGE